MSLSVLSMQLDSPCRCSITSPGHTGDTTSLHRAVPMRQRRLPKTEARLPDWDAASAKQNLKNKSSRPWLLSFSNYEKRQQFASRGALSRLCQQCYRIMSRLERDMDLSIWYIHWFIQSDYSDWYLNVERDDSRPEVFPALVLLWLLLLIFLLTFTLTLTSCNGTLCWRGEGRWTLPWLFRTGFINGFNVWVVEFLCKFDIHLSGENCERLLCKLFSLSIDDVEQWLPVGLKE